jgi:hypothetical protein
LPWRASGTDDSQQPAAAQRFLVHVEEKVRRVVAIVEGNEAGRTFDLGRHVGRGFGHRAPGLKAYNVYAPKDFAKWARICEHVIRHYNEGWAKGFRWGIEYWEIWNEPESNTMWRGSTREAFFEFYRTAALHLKAKFHGIKVGGYGSTGISGTR